MIETITGFVLVWPSFWKYTIQPLKSSQTLESAWHSPALLALRPFKITSLLLDQPVLQFSGLADFHLHSLQVNVAISWPDTSCHARLVDIVSHRSLELRSARGVWVPLKSLIQHVQLLASWCGRVAASRALLNSRCFTLWPLPSFPGRRALRCIRLVTGTRKKEAELEGEWEKEAEHREHRRKVSWALSHHKSFAVTSKLWQVLEKRECMCWTAEVWIGSCVKGDATREV